VQYVVLPPRTSVCYQTTTTVISTQVYVQPHSRRLVRKHRAYASQDPVPAEALLLLFLCCFILVGSFLFSLAIFGLEITCALLILTPVLVLLLLIGYCFYSCCSQ